jgi:hypothetical protein
MWRELALCAPLFLTHPEKLKMSQIIAAHLLPSLFIITHHIGLFHLIYEVRLGNIKRQPYPPVALKALGLPLLMAAKLPLM